MIPLEKRHSGNLDDIETFLIIDIDSDREATLKSKNGMVIVDDLPEELKLGDTVKGRLVWHSLTNVGFLPSQ